MKYRAALFRKKPYEYREDDRIFVNAMRTNCAFQYKHNEAYRKILDSYGFSPEEIREYGDIAKIPVLPTVLFKKHELFSVPAWQMPIRATSSGTNGQKSHIGFDLGGMLNALKMVLKICRRRKVLSPMPCHYIVMGYKPHRSNQMAVAKSALGATFFAPALSRTYALKYSEGKYTPDLEGVIERLKKLEGSAFPTRFMGFPSYTYFLMKMMDDAGVSVKLKKGSKILLGGGWKQHYAEQVDKETFYSLAHKVLGIDAGDVVEFFGAVEHPILYCDCENHHFHVPVYSRVIIRDVNTLEPVQNGRVGLVNLITPMIKSMPILSVMTDDIGILHDGGDCGCGIDAPYLEIIGRVGMKDLKTCAAGAAELLREVKL